MQRWHLTLVLAVLAAGGVALAGVVPTVGAVASFLRPPMVVELSPLSPDESVPTFQSVLDRPAGAATPIAAPPPPPPPPLPPAPPAVPGRSLHTRPPAELRPTTIPELEVPPPVMAPPVRVLPPDPSPTPHYCPPCGRG